MKQFFLSLIAILILVIQSSAQCPAGLKEVVITIVPDNYPQEISWTLNDAQTNTPIVTGTSNGDTICVGQNICLRFTINDSYGDGICCGYGNGSYAVSLDGVLIATGGNYTNYETTYFNCPQGFACSNPFQINTGTFSAMQNNTWYAFKPDSIGAYSISTCGSNTCDTKIWVYEQCGGLTYDNTNLGTLFYDDNSGGCGLQAVVTAYLDSAKTYYIRIGGNGSSCSGTPVNWELTYTGPIQGCMDPNACNYNPLATLAGACLYPGDPNCPMAPDLMIIQSTVASSLYQDQINAENCYVNEGCLTGFGMRDILRFTTHIKNIGDQDYYIGSPNANSGQFTYDNCHGHWHYVGYAEYLLYDMQGNGVPIGYKNGFCVLDLECSDGGTAQYGCGNMGISHGCGDIYGSGLPCQWIDITDVDTGKYMLVVRVNWDQSPDALGRVESNFENNWAQVCIHISRNAQGIPSFSLDTDCPTYVDCMGVTYGNAVLDCEGNCGGLALRGDLNADTARTITDAQLYVNKILNQTISPTACKDLNADGAITVFDAALVNNCVLNGAPNNDLCNFPRGILNPNDTVQLSIFNVNTAQQYIDIQIKNPTTKVNAYQFSMSGIKILSVQNMVPATDYPINPEFIVGGNEIIGISYQGLLIDKYNNPAPLCRVFYSELTDTMICISKITDIVNQNYERTIHQITGSCFQHTFAGIDNAENSIAYSIYPNPARDFLNLNISLQKPEKVNIQILDVVGKAVYQSQQHTWAGNILQIPLDALASGVYSLRINTGGVTITEKIVISK